MEIRATDMSSFDPSQMASKMFKKTDANGDEGIDKSEFQAMVSKMGTGDGQNAEQMFGKIDANSDGKIDKAENENALKKMGEEMQARFGKMGGMSFGGQAGSSSTIDTLLEALKNSKSKKDDNQKEDDSNSQISRLLNDLQAGNRYGQSGSLSLSASGTPSLFNLTA